MNFSMDNSNSKSIKELIDEYGDIEIKYLEHIKYSENINTLIYFGRVAFTLIVIFIAILLVIDKIKKKKLNKTLIILFVIFLILTITVFLINILPV